MPVITKQPKNVNEMVELLSVEPRLITQMPTDLTPQERQNLINVCLVSATDILEQNQQSYGTEQSEELILFSRLCLNAAEEYLANCQKHDENISSEEIEK